MSVHQVEEYYIHINIPEDKLDAVSILVGNHQELRGLDVQWIDRDLIIEGFDCESRANEIECEILELL